MRTRIPSRSGGRSEGSVEIAELAELVLAVAPVFLNLDEEFEEDLLVKEFLDVVARLDADLLDLLAPLADQDTLLGITLDVDDGHDMDRGVLLVELLDEHLGRIGNLLVIVEKELLADDLGDEETGRLVGQRILSEVGSIISIAIVVKITIIWF